MRLFIFLLTLPWWAHFAIAGGLVYWAWTQTGEGTAKIDLIEAAIERPAPPVTSMMTGKAPLTREVPEVVLRAQVDTNLTTELVQRTNGVVTSRHAMYVLVATDADQTPEDVEGLIVVPMRQKDALIQFFMRNTVGTGSVGPIVEIPGAIRSYHVETNHVHKALREHGYDTAVGEFYLTPFIDGREAGLRALAAKETEQVMMLYLIAAGFFAVGLVRMIFGRVLKSSERSRPGLAPSDAADALSRAPAPEPAVYGILTPEEEAALTPLQRIKRRQALGAAGGVAAPAGAADVASPKPGPADRSMGLRPAKPPRFSALGPSTPSKTTAKDGYDSSPIKSTRRRSRKADPFDRLAQEAGRG